MADVRYPSLTGGAFFSESVGQELGIRFYVIEQVDIHSVSWQSNSAESGVVVSIYSGSGSDADTLVYRSGSLNSVVGDNVYALPAPITLEVGTNYWLTVFNPAGSYTYKALTGLTPPQVELPFGSGDDPSTNDNLGVYDETAVPNTVPIGLDAGSRPGGTLTFHASPAWYGMTVIYDDGVGSNLPPTANAGVDQTVNAGTLVTLDASGSSDTDGTIASYAWVRTSGPANPTLSGTGATRTFTPTVVGTYVYTVTVTDDDGTTATDSVTITVNPVGSNLPPTANAGVDQSAETGTLVTLSGSGSTDSDGTISSYAWAQDSGPAVTLTGTGASRTFTPTAAGTYVFTLTVTDDDAATDTDSVTVTVTAVPVDPSDPGFNALYARMLGDEGPTTLLGYLHKTPVSGEGGGGTPAHVFRVADYGAVGDGTTDDTVAIQACINAAVAAAPDNNYAAIVEFDAKVYAIGGPIEMVDFSYGQLHIPFISASEGNPKYTLVFRGPTPAQPLVYWDQDSVQSSGAVLKSTLTSDPAGGGGGSVLAAPFNLSAAPVPDDITTFSNMFVVVENLQVLLKHNIGFGGICLKRVAQAKVDGVAVFSDRYRNSVPSMSTLPTNPDNFGLYMPEVGNNAWNEIGSFSAMGLYDGLYGQEHLSAQDLAFVYCHRGLVVKGSGVGAQWPDGSFKQGVHATWIGMLLCEAVNYWVWSDNAQAQLIISEMGGEGVSNFVEHIHDPSDLFTGEIHFHDIYNQDPEILGGARLRVVNDNRGPGPSSTTPSVSASGTPLQNPFWRDATVYLVGAVTDVSIGGVSVGAASSFRVPTGQTVELTYSSAPSWVWILD